MAPVLKKDVQVGDVAHKPLVLIPAGTKLEEIPKPMLAQLAPAHFVDEHSGAATNVKDWRPDEVKAEDERVRLVRKRMLKVIAEKGDLGEIHRRHAAEAGDDE